MPDYLVKFAHVNPRQKQLEEALVLARDCDNDE